MAFHNTIRTLLTTDTNHADNFNEVYGQLLENDLSLQGTFSNPNFIINSNLTSPINQRGQTSYQPTNGGTYTLDRWYVAMPVTLGLLVQVASTGINLSLQNGASWGLWSQVVELPASYIGETMTVSAKVDGEIITKTDILVSGTGSTGILSFYYDLTKNATVIRFELNSSTTSLNNIEWVKLELGSVATPFVPSEIENIKSLRYYNKQSDVINSPDSMVATSTTTLNGSITFSIPMRITPTIRNIVLRSNSDGSVLTVTGFSKQCNEYGINVLHSLMFASGSLVVGVWYTVTFEADAEF